MSDSLSHSCPTLLAAARAVLDGQDAAYCTTHNATGAMDPESYGQCWFMVFADLYRKHNPPKDGSSHLPCRMVKVRLVTLEETE